MASGASVKEVLAVLANINGGLCPWLADSEGRGALSDGEIAAFSVGLSALLIAVIAVVVICVRRRSRKKLCSAAVTHSCRQHR